MATLPASWELPLSGARPPWGYLDSGDIDSLLDRLDKIFPAHAPDAASACEPAQPPRPLVLFIDHDRLSCEGAANVLEEAGYEVQTARDGHSALAVLREKSADFVVLELGLEGRLSGRDILDVLRSTMEWAHIPIVLYSRTPAPTLRELRAGLGADDYVAKDGGPEALIAPLNAARQARQEHRVDPTPSLALLSRRRAS